MYVYDVMYLYYELSYLIKCMHNICTGSLSLLYYSPKPSAKSQRRPNVCEGVISYLVVLITSTA
jgi:hypothetical protein